MKSRPRNFKVICISIFEQDLEKLDDLVTQIRKLKVPRTSRSSLLRAMIRNVDPGELGSWARDLTTKKPSDE